MNNTKDDIKVITSSFTILIFYIIIINSIASHINLSKLNLADEFISAIQISIELILVLLLIILLPLNKQDISKNKILKYKNLFITNGILSVLTIFCVYTLILVIFNNYFSNQYILNLFSKLRNREYWNKDVYLLFNNCIFKPVLFEILFRFSIFKIIKLFIPKNFSIIIQALLYMLFHFEFDPVIFFIGVYSGLLFCVTENIKISIYFHCLIKIIFTFYLSILFFFIPDHNNFFDYWIASLPLIILLVLIPNNINKVKWLFKYLSGKEISFSKY